MKTSKDKIIDKIIYYSLYIIPIIGIVAFIILIAYNSKEKSLKEKTCQTKCDPYGLHATVPKDDLLFCICGGPEGPMVHEIDLDAVEK
jgi:hypothetical protein